MPNKQNLGLKKLSFHAKNLAFTPNKQKSPSMPQNKIWLPCHKIFGFHATKPKLGFHATKISFYTKNRLPCHKQNFGSHAIQNSAFKPSKNLAFPPQKSAPMPKTGFHAANKILAFTPSKIRPSSHLKNQAFCHKIWLSCLKTTI